MENGNKKWIYLIALALIWGSSFLLIKKGLIGLSPIQLGSLRIIFTTLFLLILGFNQIKKIPKESYIWIAFSGLAGSFFPVYLFAFAETEIDSSIVSVLNSLVPLFTVILSIVVFKIVIIRSQIIGVLIGLLGSILLISEGFNIHPERNNYYSLLVVLACVFYAINVNIIKHKLQNIKPLQIATGNFIIIGPLALIVLLFTPFFNSENLSNNLVQESLLYVVVLSVFGTGIAKIFFNKMVQISTPVFASSVTYLIPIVAIFWGIFDNETLSYFQIFAFFVILIGVYLVNKKK